MDQPSPKTDPCSLETEFRLSGSQSIDQMFIEWRESLRRRRRVQRRLRYMGVGTLASYLVLEYVFGWHLPSLLFILYPALLIPYAVAWFYNRYLTTQTVDQVDNVDDKRFVGHFVEMSTQSEDLKMSAQIRGAAYRALDRLLPRLTREDGALVNDYHRKILRKFASSEPGLAVPTLKAWEQIGGKEELPIVEKLAKGDIFSQDTPKIRNAAADCLPYLRVNVEAEKQRETLLRASSQSEENESILLRPAASTQDGVDYQLLRPAE